MSKKNYIVLLLAALFAFCLDADAQQQIQTLHKVKKRETIYGIARDYNITIEELIGANPEMLQPGYALKKGSTINIPFPQQQQQQPQAPKQPKKDEIDDKTAEQLLNSAQQDEKNVQRKVQKNPSKRKSLEKDW
jgi:LysM repeat protein